MNSLDKDVYKFQVRDFDTVLVGFFEDNIFYVQRGDGVKYEYDSSRIVWSEKICSSNENKSIEFKLFLGFAIDDSEMKSKAILEIEQTRKKIEILNNAFKKRKIEKKWKQITQKQI